MKCCIENKKNQTEKIVRNHAIGGIRTPSNVHNTRIAPQLVEISKLGAILVCHTEGITELIRVLLSNTGRGGELAIFTALVHAYRKACPDAYIRVATCHNGIYHHIWETNQDIDDWQPLIFRKPMPTGKTYRSSTAAEADYHVKTKHEFDRQEMLGETTLSPDRGKSITVRPILNNIYSLLKCKPFTLAEIERKVIFWPTDEDHKAAEKVIDTYGTDLVLISHIAKSASAILDVNGYQKLADKLSKTHPVAYTGNKLDPPLKGHIDLRGTTFRFVYALSQRLNYYIGPDTATTWIATVMPGLLITIRGDKAYPVGNTGLELDLVKGAPGNSNRSDRRIDSIISSLHSRQVQYVN